MTTVRSIAKEAGVSVATVSRALNNDPAISEKTRELVLTVANTQGYTARIGRRITTNIGFAYTGEQSLSHPFEAGVLDGITKGVEESNFNVVLLNLRRGKRQDETYTQYFMRNGVRGVMLRVVEASRHTCEEIANEHFPHVVISESFPDSIVNCIDCESRADSTRAVEYLITLGHRRIALALHNTADRDSQDRFDGYKEAMLKNNLPIEDDLVFRYPATLSGGATALKMIMSMRNRPTAVYCADWMLAVGVVKVAHELGVQIPEDLSIIGFDDADLRYCVHPTLTAVCQDAIKLGIEASSHLVKLLTEKNNEDIKVTLSTFFEVNGSTCPPSNAGAVS